MSDGRLDVGPIAVVEAVRTGLDSLTLAAQGSTTHWTKAIKAELCNRGRALGCRARASGVGFSREFGREWLYDVTWTEYNRGYEPGAQNQLFAVHLVAECELGNFAEIKEDFEKLLLARATLRLMIYHGNQDPGSDAIADQLAEYVTSFRDTNAPDAWLFASLERDADTGGCSFRFFGVNKLTGRAVGEGMFAPGVNWGDEKTLTLEDVFRQCEAMEAARRDHDRRTARQQPLSGLKLKF